MLASWDKNRLKEVVDLWNKELKNKFPMREELFMQNSFDDENVCFDASRFAVNDENEVIGFVIGKRWQEELDVEMREETGWIQALLVHPEYQEQGIGSKLLAHAEKAFREAGMKHILLGKDPWHYFPGIPDEYEKVRTWFEKKGYEHFGIEYDMINEYDKDSDVSVPAVENGEFTILQEDESEQLVAFLRRCFPGRWEYEAMKYFEKGGTGREFVVLKKHEEIVGFCRINDKDSPFIAQNTYWAPLFDNELAGLGPLGIDAKERGNGYGLAIVEAAIAFLRRRGHRRIVIDWTGLVDFYAKLGYKKWKAYHSYEKYL